MLQKIVLPIAIATRRATLQTMPSFRTQKQGTHARKRHVTALLLAPKLEKRADHSMGDSTRQSRISLKERISAQMLSLRICWSAVGTQNEETSLFRG